MSTDETPALQDVTTKLHHAYDLSDDDRAALQGLPLHKAVPTKGQDVVRVGDQADCCTVILRGMAFSYKLTGGGQRQILGFHLAGDIPDLQNLWLDRTDMALAAMSGCHVGFVTCNALNALRARRPSLANVLSRETLSQAAVVREWLLNVGRRNALGRLAHLMCEMVVRHQIAGLTSDYTCSFPLSHMVLADALGLSTVHVSRTIQELRGQSLIELKGAHLTALDWVRLCETADFDPTYLHLSAELLVP